MSQNERSQLANLNDVWKQALEKARLDGYEKGRRDAYMDVRAFVGGKTAGNGVPPTSKKGKQAPAPEKPETTEEELPESERRGKSQRNWWDRATPAERRARAKKSSWAGLSPEERLARTNSIREKVHGKPPLTMAEFLERQATK